MQEMCVGRVGVSVNFDGNNVEFNVWKIVTSSSAIPCAVYVSNNSRFHFPVRTVAPNDIGDGSNFLSLINRKK